MCQISLGFVSLDIFVAFAVTVTVSVGCGAGSAATATTPSTAAIQRPTTAASTVVVS